MAEELDNLELQMLLNNKETGYNYRKRREEQWRENYELYRDKVIVNRLKIFQDSIAPVLKYYQDLDRLVRVDAEQSVDKISEQILSKM